MKKWVVPIFLYVLFMAVALGAPWMVILKRQPFQPLNTLLA